MVAYLHWALKLCYVSFDIINPSNIFNIYNLENPLPYMAHIGYFILCKPNNAHDTHVNATMGRYLA
jgi:hypothetical protein